MRDDKDFIPRAAALLVMTWLVTLVSVRPASAFEPFDPPPYRQAIVFGNAIGDTLGNVLPTAFRNSRRMELLEPGELICSMRLVPGVYGLRFLVPASGDTLGGDATLRAVPGGPYTTTAASSPADSIRIQVATAGWYVLRLNTVDGTWRAEAKPAIPTLLARAFTGVPAVSGADSAVTRTATFRWLRDREAEARPDFGGYRIYRQFTRRDTTNMDLLRRFALNDTLLWHFPVTQEVLQFVDPDSTGNIVKVCRILDLQGRCVSVGDSVFRFVAPAGPHDGFAVYYTVTLGSVDQTLRETADMFVPDVGDDYARCNVHGDPTSCPNLNGKYQNLIDEPVFVSGAPESNVEQVYVVPNPYRGGERWDQPGTARVQFVNLPARATVRVFTIAGDLVRELEHDDPLSGNLSWNLKNGDGRDVSSGIYLFHVVSDRGFEQKGHFVVVR